VIMAEDQSELLLEAFATTTDPVERVRVLTALMTVKALPKRADDPRFGLGLDKWVDVANQSGSAPRDQLLAIAELVRATQQLKKRQPEMIKRVQPAFLQPIPPLTLLEDADDRLNVARACSMTEAPWLQTYRANSLANETAPKPRAELMAGIVARVESISEVLDLLQAAFDGIRPATENPAESLAKRLVKTLEIFRSTALSSLLDAGHDVGKKLDSFIRSTFSSTGRPTDQAIQIDLTREVALTLHDMVRSRFSLATESQTFQALQYCRAFFQSISWPSEVQSETDLLVRDVSEALVMLGRMGVPNQDLLNRLELTCGIKERARVVAVQLAEKHTEIDEPIRAWLKTGRVMNTITTSDVLQESLLGSLDEALGMALIEARAFKCQSDSEQRISNSLEIFDPSLVAVFRGIYLQAVAMLRSIEDLAKRRELDLFGSVGEEVDFAPKYFDTLGTLNGTRVVIRRPAVVKVAVNGTIGTVIKKGLVE